MTEDLYPVLQFRAVEQRIDGIWHRRAEQKHISPLSDEIAWVPVSCWKDLGCPGLMAFDDRKMVCNVSAINRWLRSAFGDRSKFGPRQWETGSSIVS